MIGASDKVRIYEIAPGVSAGMTKKAGGNFRPEGYPPNNLPLAGKLRHLIQKEVAAPKDLVMRAEHHTCRVVSRFKPSTEELFCDGVLWQGPGLATFFPGGCGALAFHDPRENLSGLLHCSRETVGKEIVAHFLVNWAALGGSPRTTSIRLLPAICGRCLTYDIPHWETVIRPALSKFQGVEDFTERTGDRISLHLMLFVAHLLRRSGYEQIEDRFVCTCHSREYWCYRCHDKGGRTYRNAAFVLVE